jgi:vacuolar-type H+-ATPase catalytic subunit A/Vma1
MSKKIQEGRIIRISGPVIEADGMRGAKMYDVVKVGEARHRSRWYARSKNV